MVLDAGSIIGIVSAGGIAVGSILALLGKICYASKCSKVLLCWGCIECNRETQNENRTLENIQGSARAL